MINNTIRKIVNGFKQDPPVGGQVLVRWIDGQDLFAVNNHVNLKRQ